MKATIFFILSTILISACVPKSDLDAANDQIIQLQAENARLKAMLEKKPELPVTLGLRKAMMGPGYVAVFNTTVKSSVPVLATIKSTALGSTKQFELHLNPSASTELGHMEGATIENGDTITLENKNFTSVTFTVNAQ